MDTPMERPVYRIHHRSRCGNAFSWDEEAEQAQAPELCEDCRPAQEAAHVLNASGKIEGLRLELVGNLTVPEQDKLA